MMLFVEGQRRFLDTVGSPFLGRYIGIRPSWGIPSESYVAWLDKDSWGADNGAFVGFEPAKFERFIHRLSFHRENCRFVVAPDSVCDMAATLKLFDWWGKQLRRKGFPVALALQNGEGRIPWDECDAVFVGGDTRFKLSSRTVSLITEAKARGKWVHVGRVNQNKRIRQFKALGVDSFDGSGFSQNVKHIKRALKLLEDTGQTSLEPTGHIQAAV